MKRLIPFSALGGVLALALISGGGHTSAQTSATNTPVPPTATPAGPTPTAPPVQGKKLNLVLTADTVQGAGGQPAPAVGCSQTNLFRRGQVIVFRMWGINAKYGGVALIDKNVKSATIQIPGQATPLKMTYGAHGKAPNAVAFWSAPWFTKADTSLGEVDFTIVVVTKADKKHKIKSLTGRYSQVGFAVPSRLTITP